MSEIFKTSGKKIKIPLTKGEWSFEKRPGVYWIATHTDGRRMRVAVSQIGGLLSVSLPSRTGRLAWNGDVQAEKSYKTAGHSKSDSDWVAQFPGKVRKVLVTLGAQVKEGDSLLLVEAMKMEFPVKAPYECKILKILVQENQQLNPGDRFFEVEVANGG
ncbi:MAG: biotin/lipoyl-containing protein [Bdellovibrionota bacterium]